MDLTTLAGHPISGMKAFNNARAEFAFSAVFHITP